MNKYDSDNPKYPTSNRMDSVVVFEIVTTSWLNDGMPTQDEQARMTMAQLRRCFKMNQPDEIVGIATATLTLRDEPVIGEPSVIFVKPKLSEVSDITLDQLGVSRTYFNENSVPLAEALWRMRTLTADTGSLPCWASWGDYPARKIKRDCERVKARHPFSSRMINTKAITPFLLRTRVDLSMSQVVELVDIEQYGISSDLVDDFADNRRTIVGNVLVSAAITAWSLS